MCQPMALSLHAMPEPSPMKREGFVIYLSIYPSRSYIRIIETKMDSTMRRDLIGIVERKMKTCHSLKCLRRRSRHRVLQDSGNGFWRVQLFVAGSLSKRKSRGPT